MRERKPIRHKRRKGVDRAYEVPGGPAVLTALVPIRRRRHEGHPHPLANGADMHRHEMPDSGKSRESKPSYITRGHAEAVERNALAIASIDPAVARVEEDIYADKLAEGKRPKYAALETHREMATFRLASGATYEEAADYAGVTVASIARWMAEDAFQDRVNEMRATAMSMIQGRLIQNFVEITEPDRINELELADRLRIYDRTQPIGAKAATTAASRADSPEGRYDGLIQILVEGNGGRDDRAVRGPSGPRRVGQSGDGAGAEQGADAAPESPRFPVIEIAGPAVAGGSS